MGAFDDLIPKRNEASRAASAPGGAFGDLIPQPDAPSMGETALRGLAQGATFGLADEAFAAGAGARSWMRGDGFQEGYDRAVAKYRAGDKAAKAANPVTSVASEIAGGLGTGLGAAKGGFTLFKGGMTLPQMIRAGAAEGAAYGAAYGAGNAEGGVGDRLSGAYDGAKSGAVVGGAVPVAARAIGAGISRAVSPMPVSAERQAMIGVLEREGVPLTAGQRTGSIPLRYAESILGDAPFAGGPKARVMEAQGEAFTEAAMRRMGGAGRATSDNMASNYDRIGQQFQQLSARNTMQADPQLGRDLGSVLNGYEFTTLPAEQKKIVGDLVSDLVERIRQNGGSLPGEAYQAFRSNWSKTANQNRGSAFGDAMRGLRDAIDNNMMRSISPEDAGAWQVARREYGNWKDLAKAAGGAGENSAQGLVSPQALRSAVASGPNKEAFVRGEGDFAELARAGNAIMTPLPNSGTAQRNLMTGIAGGSGGTMLAGGGDPLMAAIVSLGPSVFGRALWSGPVQRYLSNQTISPAARQAIEARVRAALQGGSQSQSRKLEVLP